VRVGRLDIAARQDGDGQAAGGDGAHRQQLVALEGNPGGDARGGQGGVAGGAQGRAALERDQRLAVECGKREPPAPAERVVGRDRGHELLVEQLRAVELGAGFVRTEEGEGEVEVAAPQHGERARRRVLVQADGDGRVGDVEGGDERRDVEADHRGHRPHRHAAAPQAAQGVELVRDVRRLGEHPPRACQQHLARLREGDLAAGAAQEVDAELALEPAHLLGHRGLRDHELLARAREAAVAGHRLERAQLAQFHSAMLWVAVTIGL